MTKFDEGRNLFANVNVHDYGQLKKIYMQCEHVRNTRRRKDRKRIIRDKLHVHDSCAELDEVTCKEKLTAKNSGNEEDKACDASRLPPPKKFPIAVMMSEG